MALTEYAWPIDWIDRGVADLEGNYQTVLGAEYSLLQSAYDLGVQANAAARPLRILDVGCGTGRALRGLALNTRRQLPGCAIQAVGVNFEDFSRRSRSKSTQAAIAGGEITYLRGDAADLPVCDGSFDLVYEHEMLIHSDGNETIKRFQEMERALAPGGRMYFGIYDQPQLAPPMRQLKQQGYRIDGKLWSGRTERSNMVGKTATRLIFCMDKPTETC